MIQSLPGSELPPTIPLEVTPERARHYREILTQAITILSLPAPLPVDQAEFAERHETVAGLRRLVSLFAPLAGDEALTDPADDLLLQVAASLGLVLGMLQIQSDYPQKVLWGKQKEALIRKTRRFEEVCDG